MLARFKHASLLCQSVNYGQKSFVTLAPGGVSWRSVKVSTQVRHDIQNNDTRLKDTEINDTQHDDIQRNDTKIIGTQHKDIHHDYTQHNDTRHNEAHHDGI